MANYDSPLTGAQVDSSVAGIKNACSFSGSGASQTITELSVDNLKLDGNVLSSTDTNGNIDVTPDGSGDVNLVADAGIVGDLNANVKLTTNGTGDLTISTNSGTNSGSILIPDGADSDMTLHPDGDGDILLETDVVKLGSGAESALITTAGTGHITINGQSGVNTAQLKIYTASDGNVELFPGGSGGKAVVKVGVVDNEILTTGNNVPYRVDAWSGGAYGVSLGTNANTRLYDTSTGVNLDLIDRANASNHQVEIAMGVAIDNLTSGAVGDVELGFQVDYTSNGSAQTAHNVTKDDFAGFLSIESTIPIGSATGYHICTSDFFDMTGLGNWADSDPLISLIPVVYNISGIASLACDVSNIWFDVRVQ